MKRVNLEGAKSGGNNREGAKSAKNNREGRQIKKYCFASSSRSSRLRGCSNLVVRMLSGEEPLDRIHRCLPLHRGDRFEQRDIFRADFHAVPGFAAVGYAAFFHHDV
jgi:hypothetical protein